ncbi:hypothetical protein [Flavobacterium silvaticum]|uniref:Uncharacterized protein n=1 Tax=Flavobacterium silvaticum TaxID=1852020 RepID=A0A972FQZ3_9FLAO|nr:hypothetical protein [Flavobacterium silvaticum]NMH26873.1 hypothetical protein [Flavobacterium silvaticum]
MKSFKTVFAILVSLGIHSVLSAGTLEKHQGNKTAARETGELKKYKPTDDTPEIFGSKTEDYSDHVRKMVHGNQITDYNTVENAYRPLEIADKIVEIEKDRLVTEFEEPKTMNLKICDETVSETKLITPAKL